MKRIIIMISIIGILFASLVPAGCVNDNEVGNEVNGEDEAVIFSDPNIEQTVREEIGKPVGDIYNADLMDLTELSIRDKGVSNLSGLERCTNLSKLILNQNNISDLSPLSSLAKLETLMMPGNQISDITPLTSLESLKNLVLSQNQLRDLTPLTELKNLTSLAMESNNISDISVLSDMPWLTHVMLDDNNISDITPLEGMDNLTSLTMMMNQVEDLSPLSGKTELRTLYMSFNRITDISPLEGMLNLEALSVNAKGDGPTFSDISAVSTMEKLREFQAMNQDIEDITPLMELAALESVWLSGNPLNDHARNLLLPELQNRGVMVLGDFQESYEGYRKDGGRWLQLLSVMPANDNVLNAAFMRDDALKDELTEKYSIELNEYQFDHYMVPALGHVRPNYNEQDWEAELGFTASDVERFAIAGTTPDSYYSAAVGSFDEESVDSALKNNPMADKLEIVDYAEHSYYSFGQEGQIDLLLSSGSNLLGQSYRLALIDELIMSALKTDYIEDMLDCYEGDSRSLADYDNYQALAEVLEDQNTFYAFFSATVWTHQKIRDQYQSAIEPFVLQYPDLSLIHISEPTRPY